MKAYVVNLKRDAHRMESVRKQLDAHGLSFQRIEAVLGSALTKASRRKDVAGIRSWFASGGGLKDGEIGCALSHLEVYKRMLASGDQCALVLEDDIILAKGFLSSLAVIEKAIDVRIPQVYFPSRQSMDESSSSCNYRIEPVDSAICTDAYVLTLPVAKLLLSVNHPVVSVADSWSRWHKRYGVELYRCIPFSVYQDIGQFGTNIAEKSDGWMCMPIMRLVCRRVLKLVDLLTWKLFGR